MPKGLLIFIAFLFILFVLPKQAFATFDISLTEGSRAIDFGTMKMGEEKMISGRGDYEQQFNFISDNARIWYFKAQLVMPFSNGTYSIPAENFQWMVQEVKNGQGAVSANILMPSPFLSYPALIYTSAGSDNTGTEVKIRLRYKLEIPKRQPAGSYTAQIRFIMVEEL